MSHSPPLLARADELRVLGECLAWAASGQGNSVLVVGEAGIGKTRLLEALADMGHERDFQVAWGRAWETSEAPAFWPWREALKALRAGHDTAEDLAGLLALHRHPDGAAGEFERARLFEATRAFIACAAEKAPVLILLDDLHAADASSLVLAEFLGKRLRESRVLLAASHREHDLRRDSERASLIGRLQRQALVLLPKRFDATEVADLVSSEFGLSDPETARMVHGASDGNPLFAREIARLLAARGRVDAVPAGLQAVVRERLALLSPATVALLQTAAVIGRDFALVVAAEAAGVLPDAVAESLAEAEAAEVISPVGIGQYRFVHGIWAEALVEMLAPGQRQRAHLRVAEALRHCHQNAPDAPLATLAHHLTAAGPTSAPDAWPAAEAAAMQADGRLAFEDAAKLYEMALASLAVCAPTDFEHRLRLTLRLLAAHRHAGHAEAAWRVCQTATDWARASNRPDILAEAALTWGAEFSAGEVNSRHVALLEEALGVLPSGDSALRARVLARLAAAQQPSPDPTGPVALAREAVAMIERTREQAARLPVLNAAAEAVLCYVPPAERLSLDEEVSRLARAAANWPAVFQAQVRLAFTHIESANLAASASAIAEVEVLADRFPQSRLRWPALLLRSMQPLFAGQFADASAAEARVAALVRESPDSEGERALAIRRVARLATQTDAESLQIAVHDSLTHAPGGSLVAEVISAWSCAQLGDAAAVRAGLARIPAQAVEALLFDPTLGLALAESACVARDPQLAARALERLSVHRGRPVMLTLIGYAMWDLADRVLLRLASLLERWDEADGFARSGEQLALRIGARPFVARLWLDWAISLRTRGGDADRARALATQARESAEALGMPGLRKAADAFLPAGSAKEQSIASAAACALWPEPATCTRDGEDWIVRGAGETCRVRNSRGVQILALLLARPGQDIHVLDLMTDGVSATGTVIDRGDAGETLDIQARRDYLTRLTDLQSELEEAKTWNDSGRAQTLASEKAQLENALAEALGIGGRSRRIGSASERARVNVQRRLTDALRRIREISPALGRHLSISVRTGTVCSYQPDAPRAPR